MRPVRTGPTSRRIPNPAPHPSRLSAPKRVSRGAAWTTMIPPTKSAVKNTTGMECSPSLTRLFLNSVPSSSPRKVAESAERRTTPCPPTPTKMDPSAPLERAISSALQELFNDGMTHRAHVGHRTLEEDAPLVHHCHLVTHG